MRSKGAVSYSPAVFPVPLLWALQDIAAGTGLLDVSNTTCILIASGAQND